jgi:hypothetical protein
MAGLATAGSPVGVRCMRSVGRWRARLRDEHDYERRVYSLLGTGVLVDRGQLRCGSPTSYWTSIPRSPSRCPRGVGPRAGRHACGDALERRPRIGSADRAVAGGVVAGGRARPGRGTGRPGSGSMRNPVMRPAAEVLKALLTAVAPALRAAGDPTRPGTVWPPPCAAGEARVDNGRHSPVAVYPPCSDCCRPPRLPPDPTAAPVAAGRPPRPGAARASRCLWPTFGGQAASGRAARPRRSCRWPAAGAASCRRC